MVVVLIPKSNSQECWKAAAPSEAVLGCTGALTAKMLRSQDAMGLPDPVAFAMLTALGAIPDPMAMLNEMMAAAAPEDEEKTAFWKSGPAQAEAADSAELERLAKQVGTLGGRSL